MNLKNTDLDKLYICNIIDKRRQQGFSEHCLNHCKHGRFHYKDDCTQEEWCNLHESGETIKVKCRKIKKKEIKELCDGNSNYFSRYDSSR
jgi:hypothetical protein